MFKKITQNILKAFFATLLVATFAFCLLPSEVKAAEFLDRDSGANVNVEKHTINPYALGNEINFTNNISGDLVAIGSKVSLDSIYVNDGGVIIFSARDVNINTKRVEKNVKVFAGGKVTISNVFRGDVLIIANEVEITNETKILGDLIVRADNLTVGKDIKIEGDIYADYSKYKGEQKLSEITAKEVKDFPTGEVNYSKEEISSKLAFAKFALWKVGGIVFLIILAFFLSKKRKLEQPAINLTSRFGYDLLTGLLTLLISVFAAFLFLLLPPLTVYVWLVAILTSLLFALSSIYTPIYVTNLIKNQFQINFKFSYLLAMVVVLMVALPYIPFVGGLFSLFNTIFSIGGFGYVLTSIYKIFKKALNEKQETGNELL